MDKTKTRAEMFSVICPFLKNRKITLYKDTWLNHICSNHEEVMGCADLIKKTLSANQDGTVSVYQKRRDQRAIAIYKRCSSLDPIYSYIAITVKFHNDRIAVMTSCYGKHDITNLDMEAYDGH